MGAQELTLNQYPSKIQRYKEKTRKESKNQKIFTEKLHSAFYGEIAIFCADTCAHYAGRTRWRVGLNELLIYAFVIRIYYSYKYQLHKHFVVTSKKIASVYM